MSLKITDNYGDDFRVEYNEIHIGTIVAKATVDAYNNIAITKFMAWTPNSNRYNARTYNDMYDAIEYLQAQAFITNSEAIKESKNTVPITSAREYALAHPEQFTDLIITIKNTAKDRSFIQAVKFWRALTGCGLKEARDQVEEMLNLDRY